MLGVDIDSLVLVVFAVFNAYWLLSKAVARKQGLVLPRIHLHRLELLGSYLRLASRNPERVLNFRGRLGALTRLLTRVLAHRVDLRRRRLVIHDASV